MKTLPDHRPDDTLVGRWELDPQRSSVEFRVGHFWGLATVKGHFDDYEGRLDLGADPAIELTIDAASVQTGNPKRDQHLRSAPFFDAENHPSVQFVSDSVVLQGDTLSVRGGCSPATGRSRSNSTRGSAASTASSRSRRPPALRIASWG